MASVRIITQFVVILIKGKEVAIVPTDLRTKATRLEEHCELAIRCRYFVHADNSSLQHYRHLLMHQSAMNG